MTGHEAHRAKAAGVVLRRAIQGRAQIQHQVRVPFGGNVDIQIVQLEHFAGAGIEFHGQFREPRSLGARRGHRVPGGRVNRRLRRAHGVHGAAQHPAQSIGVGLGGK